MDWFIFVLLYGLTISDCIKKDNDEIEDLERDCPCFDYSGRSSREKDKSMSFSIFNNYSDYDDYSDYSDYEYDDYFDYDDDDYDETNNSYWLMAEGVQNEDGLHPAHIGNTIPPEMRKLMNYEMRRYFPFMTLVQPESSDKCLTEFIKDDYKLNRQSKVPDKSRWEWDLDGEGFRFPSKYPQRYRHRRAAIMNWPNVDYDENEEFVNKKYYDKFERTNERKIRVRVTYSGKDGKFVNGKKLTNVGIMENGEYRHCDSTPERCYEVCLEDAQCSDCSKNKNQLCCKTCDEDCTCYKDITTTSVQRVNKVQCQTIKHWDSENKSYRLMPREKLRWSHQKNEEGRTTVPVAFHWSVPKCLIETFKTVLTNMHKDLGGMKFEFEENPRRPKHKYGVLIVYEIKNDYGKCQAGQFKGLTHGDASNKFKLYEGHYGPKTISMEKDCQKYMKTCYCPWGVDSCHGRGQNCEGCKVNTNGSPGVYEDCKSYEEGLPDKNNGSLHDVECWKNLKPECNKYGLNKYSCAPKYDVEFDDDREPAENYISNKKFKLVYRSERNQKYNQMLRTWQILHFSTDCFCAGNIQHEMMHALGFLHEQANPQRDEFIHTNEAGFRLKASRNPSAYRILNPKGNAITPYPLETGSLLLYGPEVFVAKETEKFKIHSTFLSGDQCTQRHEKVTDKNPEPAYKFGCPCNGQDPGIFSEYKEKEKDAPDCPNPTPCIRKPIGDAKCDSKAECSDDEKCTFYENDIWCKRDEIYVTKKGESIQGRACYPEKCADKCKTKTITYWEYNEINERFGEEKQELAVNAYSLKSHLLGNTKESMNLWVKNRHKMTTTDAFNIDWFFTKAFSSFMPPSNPVMPEDVTNQYYVHKETVDCLEPDLVGIIRPVFKDRLCDGIVDCFNGEDEDGRLAQCKPNEHKSSGSRCSYTFKILSDFIDTCTPIIADENDQFNDGQPVNKDWPVWECSNVPNRRNRRIYWSSGVYDGKDIEYDFTELQWEKDWVRKDQDEEWAQTLDRQTYRSQAKGKSGWVFSESTLESDTEPRKYDIRKPLAFHPVDCKALDPTDGPCESCPPEGQWKYSMKRHYGRVFSYSHIAVKDPETPETVTVCGSRNAQINGQYVKEGNEYKKKGAKISFNELNKAWTVSVNGDPEFANYFTGSGMICDHAIEFTITSSYGYYPTYKLRDQELYLMNYFEQSSPVNQYQPNPHWIISTDPNPSTGLFAAHGHSINGPQWWKSTSGQPIPVPTLNGATFEEDDDGWEKIDLFEVELLTGKQFRSNTIWLCSPEMAENYGSSVVETNWLHKNRFHLLNSKGGGPIWREAIPINGAALPGTFKSNHFEWKSAPFFKVFDGEDVQECPHHGSLPEEIFICDSNARHNINGKYKLQILDVSTGHPYYEMEDLTQPSVLFYKDGNWRITNKNDRDGVVWSYVKLGSLSLDEKDGGWTVMTPEGSVRAFVTISNKCACELLHYNSNDESDEGNTEKLNLPKTLEICGSEVVSWRGRGYDKADFMSPDGTYDLQRGQINRMPFYKISSVSNKQPFYLYYSPVDSGTWILDDEINNDMGRFFKPNRDLLDDTQWKVNSVGLRIPNQNSDQSRLRINSECPLDSLPVRLFVCGDDFFGLNGEYRLNVESADQHVFVLRDNENKFIYFDKESGSWIIGWDTKLSVGWYELKNWYIAHPFSDKTQWVINENIPHFVGQNNFYRKRPVTVSTSACLTTNVLFACNGKKLSGEMRHVAGETINGKEYFQSVDNSIPFYLIWEGSGWLITETKQFTSIGHYYLKSPFLLKQSNKWLEAKSGIEERVEDQLFSASDFFLQEADCSFDVQTQVQTEATTTEESTTEEVGLLTFATDDPSLTVCPDGIEWMANSDLSSIEFTGEKSMVVKTSVFSVLEFDLTDRYMGFLVFSQAACGPRILNGLTNGDLKWSIVDKGHFYRAQYTFMNNENETVTLQFVRHSHAAQDIGSEDRDIFYLVFHGTDKMANANFEQCFTKFDIGIIQVDEGMDVNENFSKCAV